MTSNPEDPTETANAWHDRDQGRQKKGRDALFTEGLKALGKTCQVILFVCSKTNLPHCIHRIFLQKRRLCRQLCSLLRWSTLELLPIFTIRGTITAQP